MARKRRDVRAPVAAPSPSAAPSPEPEPPASPPWLDAVLQVARRVLGRIETIRLALVVTALGAALSAGWVTGPGRVIHERETATMTARALGYLERAWLWIDFDPARMEPPARRWYGAARARTCGRIRFEAAGTPASVALCSLWFPFHESWTPLAARELAPGVPFAWDRGEDALPRVELRLPGPALAWLRQHPGAEPGATAGAGATALGDLSRQLDYPVELIVETWSQTPASREVPMAFAPGRLDRALPVASLPRGPRPLTGVGVLVVAMALWGLLVRRETAGWGRPLRWAVAIVPILALPWWGERLPSVLRWMWPPSAQLFATFTENVSPIEGMLSRADPGTGESLGAATWTWTLGASSYAGTLGRFALRVPSVAGRAGPDAALAALAAQLQAQVLAWPDAPLAGLFDRLAADDGAGRNRVGVVFVPAARAAFLDPRRGEGARRAALGFLDQFLTAPHDDPRPTEPAFEGKLRIWASLLDFPVDHVRHRASWVFGRVGRPAPAAPQ